MKFNFKQAPERVSFTEKGHTYKDSKGRGYISVTTLVGLYHEEFDTQYWSLYKAIKDVMETLGGLKWRRFKKEAGGWENVVKHYQKIKYSLDNQLLKRIKEKKREYVVDWKREGDDAARMGTKAHKELEQLLISSQKVEIGSRSVADVSPSDLLDIQGFNDKSNNVFPEFLLWNQKYRIAGQVDLIEKQGDILHLRDYKTCKEIKFEAFMGKTMYSPLQELPDTNYSKFTLQLSLYAWMLEQEGFTIGSLTLDHIDRETGNYIERYTLAYRRDLIVKLLKDYEHKRN